MAFLLFLAVQGQVGMQEPGGLARKLVQNLGTLGLRGRSCVVGRSRSRGFLARGPGRLLGLRPCLMGLFARGLIVGMLPSAGFGDVGPQLVEKRVAAADRS